MPEIVFRIVDLPAPLAPSTVAIWPWRTDRLTPRIARIGPYALSTLSSLRMAHDATPCFSCARRSAVTSSAEPR